MIRWKFWAKPETDRCELVRTNANETAPQDPSRAHFLRSAAAGLTGGVAAAVAAGIAGSTVVKATDGDPTTLGASSNSGGTPNLAEHATEVQFDGVDPPGVVLLSQADNTYQPLSTLFPAALAGWTSTNPNIPNGVYGYTEQPGAGVVGWGNVGVNLGARLIGPNRAPVNLNPEPRPMPPPTGQAGDLYVTINVDSFATLWFHTGIGGWRQVSVV